MPFPLPFVVTKELNVTGSFRFDAEFAEAVDLISSSRIDLSPLISHTYCVDHVVDAFDLAADRSRAMKVQIDFR
ncbi:L-idonate 5-dehydrogenase (NAD(P)(+)) [compost metagenome]